MINQISVDERGVQRVDFVPKYERPIREMFILDSILEKDLSSNNQGIPLTAATISESELFKECKGVIPKKEKKEKAIHELKKVIGELTLFLELTASLNSEDKPHYTLKTVDENFYEPKEELSAAQRIYTSQTAYSNARQILHTETTRIKESYQRRKLYYQQIKNLHQQYPIQIAKKHGNRIIFHPLSSTIEDWMLIDIYQENKHQLIIDCSYSLLNPRLFLLNNKNITFNNSIEDENNRWLSVQDAILLQMHPFTGQIHCTLWQELQYQQRQQRQQQKLLRNNNHDDDSKDSSRSHTPQTSAPSSPRSQHLKNITDFPTNTTIADTNGLLNRNTTETIKSENFQTLYITLLYRHSTSATASANTASANNAYANPAATTDTATTGTATAAETADTIGTTSANTFLSISPPIFMNHDHNNNNNNNHNNQLGNLNILCERNLFSMFIQSQLNDQENDMANATTTNNNNNNHHAHNMNIEKLITLVQHENQMKLLLQCLLQQIELIPCKVTCDNHYQYYNNNAHNDDHNKNKEKEGFGMLYTHYIFSQHAQNQSLQYELNDQLILQFSLRNISSSSSSTSLDSLAAMHTIKTEKKENDKREQTIQYLEHILEELSSYLFTTFKQQVKSSSTSSILSMKHDHIMTFHPSRDTLVSLEDLLDIFTIQYYQQYLYDFLQYQLLPKFTYQYHFFSRRIPSIIAAVNHPNATVTTATALTSKLTSRQRLLSYHWMIIDTHTIETTKTMQPKADKVTAYNNNNNNNNNNHAAASPITTNNPHCFHIVSNSENEPIQPTLHYRQHHNVLGGIYVDNYHPDHNTTTSSASSSSSSAALTASAIHGMNGSSSSSSSHGSLHHRPALEYFHTLNELEDILCYYLMKEKLR
jgi:hypothetical protein